MALLLAALLCLAIFYVRWNGTGTADVHREYAGAAILEQSFIFFLFLVGLMNAPVSLLVNSWTAGLGKRSYSLYLLHLPVIMILFPYIGVIRSLELPAGAVFILCATIVLIVAGALSFLSYRFIEKPGMQLGTRLLQRRHRRQEEAKG